MPYLAAVNASMAPAETASPAPPAPAAPLDLGAMAFGNAAPPPTAPIMLGGRPIAAPPMDPVPSGPLASMPQPLMSSASTPPPPPAPAGPPPPPNVNAAPPADAGPVDPHPFPLTLVGGGGVIPAHEVEMRGPSLRAAQGAANDALGAASQQMASRSEDTAQREYEMYLAQERQAQARQAAAQQAAAERDEELQQRAQDFDQSVKALSKMSLDPNRFWASRTTGQKISAMVGIALGGFVQGARGGSNAGLDIINQQIERDIKAQEFAYSAARDTANAKQTAFGMAMQKYGSVDAARSMARASALDAVQAQIAQNAALWKGTQAANHGDAMMAELENQKMQQIAQGVAFVQPKATGRIWVDPATGVTYDESQARALAKDWRTERQDIRKIGTQGAMDLLKEGGKGSAQAQKDAAQRFVPDMVVGSTKLPGYTSSTIDEAKADREGREAGARLVDMIDKVLSKREKAGYVGRVGQAVNPFNAQWENEVSALKPQMGVEWSKTKKLGTFDAGVERLMEGILGNPTAVSGATDDKLRELRAQVMNGLAVSKESQTGESRKPTTLQVYGGKK